MSGKQEIKALTSLRGVAALLVLIYHLRTEFGPAIDLDRGTAFFANGYLWVDFFFVLSGFVIALVYSDVFSTHIAPSDYGRFLVRRFARVYPLHLFVLVCFVPTEFAKLFIHTSANPAFSENTIGAFIANLFLVQAWGILPDATWNRVSWSISVEWFAYLLFPVIALLLPFVRKTVVALLLIVCALAALNLSGSLGAITGLAIVRCLCSFAAGALIYRLRGISPAYWVRIVGSDASLIASIALAIAAMHFDINHTAIVAIFVWIVAAASLNTGKAGNALSVGPLYLLGTISYSVYLMQGLVVRVWQALFQVGWHSHISTVQAIAAMALLIAATIAVSVLSYVYIEKPGRSAARFRVPKYGASPLLKNTPP